MKHVTAYAAVLSVFLLGVLVGGFGMHVLDAHRWFAPEHAGSGPMKRGDFAQHLVDALELSDEQAVEIRAILKESHTEAMALRDEVTPRIRGQIDATAARIEAVLTPDQAAEFRVMTERHRRHAERFFLGGDHRPLRRRR